MYINKYEERKKRIIKYCESFNGRPMNLNEFKNIVKLLNLFIGDQVPIVKSFFRLDKQFHEMISYINSTGFNCDEPINFNKALAESKCPGNQTILDFIIFKWDEYIAGWKYYRMNRMDEIDRLLGLKTDDEEERIHRERTTTATERTAKFTKCQIFIGVISIIVSIISIIITINLKSELQIIFP